MSGSGNLSRLFDVLAKECPDKVPGATNLEALRGQIQRWLNDGTDYSVVREMIHTYWSDSFQRSTSAPAWQDFIARRGVLFDLADKVARQADRADHRHDKDYWLGKK